MQHNMIWSMEESAYRSMLAQRISSPTQPVEKTERFPVMGSLANDARRVAGLPLYVLDRVAVVVLSGAMMKSPTEWDSMFGDVSDTGTVHAAIETAAGSSDIDAIMMLVSSPGGSVDGIAQLADSVFAARKSKPITAQVDGMCASAAYYVACQTNSVTANRMDLVGSIGTRIMLYDYSEMFRMAGIKPVVVDTGEYKSAGAEGTVITDQQIADYQRLVDIYGNDFMAGVKRGRKFSEEKVRGVADGRVWTAPEALSLGLIDGIKTNAQAFEEVRKSVRTSARASRAKAQASIMGIGV